MGIWSVEITKQMIKKTVLNLSKSYILLAYLVKKKFTRDLVQH